MSKAALNNHLAARRHSGCFVIRTNGLHTAPQNVKIVQNIKIQNQTGSGGLLDFSSGVLSIPVSDESSSTEDEGNFSTPPTPTRCGDKPDLKFLFWCAKQTEKQLCKPDVRWCFCGQCNSAFFNEEIFISHLSTCC